MIILIFCAFFEKVNTFIKDFSFQLSGIGCGDDFLAIPELHFAFLILTRSSVNFNVTDLDVKGKGKC